MASSASSPGSPPGFFNRHGQLRAGFVFLRSPLFFPAAKAAPLLCKTVCFYRHILSLLKTINNSPKIPGIVQTNDYKLMII
jgi:hypothetical protein